MRLRGALITDYIFQFKQGFYIIYILLTIMYMFVLSLLPNSYKQMALPLLIFSDPAFIGLFFIGGIIMLERMQGVLHFLVVTPLRVKEYLLAKMISLSTLAIVASLAITLSANYQGNINYIFMILGTLLVSIFFILIGIVVTSSCRTLNQYIMKMIPAVLLLVLPCFSILGTGYQYLWTVFPSVAGLRVIVGAFYTSQVLEMLGLISYLLVCCWVLFYRVVMIFENKMIYGGE